MDIHSKSWRPWRPVSANFFHFPPKFRLRTWKPSRLHCTNASPSVCRRCFVFNINTSYIDLLYFDNLLLKTPDLCNLLTFVAIFFVAIYALFPPFFLGQKADSANLFAFWMYGLLETGQLSSIMKEGHKNVWDVQFITKAQDETDAEAWKRVT